MTDKTEQLTKCIKLKQRDVVDRNCAEHGCGCCGAGDIRFNVVGEGDWALKAAEKAKEEM